MQMLGENLLLSQNYCKVTKQYKIIVGTFCHWYHPQFIIEPRVSKYSELHIENETGGGCSTYMCINALVGKPERKNYMEDQDVDESIILKWNLMDWSNADRILWKWYWTLGSIRCGEFFDELRNWQFLKDSVSWTVGNILLMSATVSHDLFHHCCPWKLKVKTM